ncbi:MAG: hypothetical protein J5I94_21740 [Phaeodactylibacter sp.]|nr:hypothetical protein [Phaeodactylibacter sp.]
MRSTNSCLFLVLLLAFGCRQEGGKTAEKAPKTLEEYTQAIIKEVQKVILSTDQQLREYPPQKVKELPAEEGRPARTLQLWTEEGNPVKLTVSTPGDPGLTAFYFANGELFYAADGEGGYIFIGPELKYRLNENWKPVEAPEAERRKKEEELLEEARRYLGGVVD